LFLSTVGKNLLKNLLLWENKFEYRFSKVLSDVCS